MEPDWARLGAAVREARKIRGLTQAGLGDLVGVGETTVANIERGRVKKITPTMRAIAREFGWPAAAIDDLLHGGPDPAVTPGRPATADTAPEATPNEGVPLRIARALAEGATLDTRIVPLGPNSDMVVVVKARRNATPEELERELLEWERKEGHLERLGEVADDPSPAPRE